MVKEHLGKKGEVLGIYSLDIALDLADRYPVVSVDFVSRRVLEAANFVMAVHFPAAFEEEHAKLADVEGLLAFVATLEGLVLGW